VPVPELFSHTRVLSIVGDILTIRARGVALGELAWVENSDGTNSLAQVTEIDRERVSLQVFAGGKGLRSDARVSFVGHAAQVVYCDEILGRIFDGVGQPIDGGPELLGRRRIEIGGPSVNPMMRVVPSKMIETKVPMIDIFNCLVESQKIPIFSIAGEPYNELLARIAIQADADVVVFCGLGLIFDEFHFFRDTFENEGVFPRTVMFANRASDPIVERLLAPDLALKVAERFAVEQNKRVLVLMTDMTAFADALEGDWRGDGTNPFQPRLHG
jgi:V/A-type H+-transporting ATPase subunit B